MRVLKYILPVLFCPLLAFAAEGIVQTLSVQEAYDFIPHKRIRYEAALSTLPADEAHYLESLFALVDAAVVERVQAMQKPPVDSNKVPRNYELILHGMEKLATPESMLKAHVLISEAIILQREIITAPAAGSDARVKVASRKLIQAYGLLMQAFPGESKHNKEAFYQHLCALDYL